MTLELTREEESHLRLLQGLLPQGPAWGREDDATLTRLLAVWAVEFARVARLTDAVLLEMSPRTAVELLGEWERLLGVEAPSDDLETRQREVAVRFSHRGGCSRQYFIDLAASLGRSMTIEEYQPLAVGFAAGDACVGQAWQWAWTVHVDGPEDAVLVTAIRRDAPAHTVVLFDFKET